MVTTCVNFALHPHLTFIPLATTDSTSKYKTRAVLTVFVFLMSGKLL